MKTRPAKPIHRPAPPDEGGRLAITNKGIVLNARRHVASIPSIPTPCAVPSPSFGVSSCIFYSSTWVPSSMTRFGGTGIVRRADGVSRHEDEQFLTPNREIRSSGRHRRLAAQEKGCLPRRQFGSRPRWDATPAAARGNRRTRGARSSAGYPCPIARARSAPFRYVRHAFRDHGSRKTRSCKTLLCRRLSVSAYGTVSCRAAR